MGFGGHHIAMLLGLASDGRATLAEANYHGALSGAFPKSGFVFASPKRTSIFFIQRGPPSLWNFQRDALLKVCPSFIARFPP